MFVGEINIMGTDKAKKQLELLSIKTNATINVKVRWIGG